MRSPCLHMFVGAVMTPYSQQACATLHWRMRKTAGPPACRGPDSFLSSYGPITLHTADARAAAMPLPMEPLVCCTRTVKDPKQCGFQMPQDGSSSARWESQLFLQSCYSDVVLRWAAGEQIPQELMHENKTQETKREVSGCDGHKYVFPGEDRIKLTLSDEFDGSPMSCRKSRTTKKMFKRSLTSNIIGWF